MANKTEKPKTLEEALILIAELEQLNTNAAQAVQTEKTNHGITKDLLEAEKVKTKELGEQVNLLQKAVNVRTAGLPKAVLEDVDRRMALGLPEADAVHASLRQHKHNEKLAKDEEIAKAAKAKAEKEGKK